MRSRRRGCASTWKRGQGSERGSRAREGGRGAEERRSLTLFAGEGKGNGNGPPLSCTGSSAAQPRARAHLQISLPLKPRRRVSGAWLLTARMYGEKRPNRLLFLSGHGNCSSAARGAGQRDTASPSSQLRPLNRWMCVALALALGSQRPLLALLPFAHTNTQWWHGLVLHARRAPTPGTSPHRAFTRHPSP